MTEKRASKKQRELLTFIENFINTTGYGPSYREIMRALDYKSVSTVAVHVDGLIACGLLCKTDKSARSLEVVSNNIQNVHVDIMPHVKARLEECSIDQLKIIAEAFSVLQLPELEALVQKKLSKR